jgi:hypothetical protein
MPVPKSSGSVASLNRVQLMRHSRTHHSRSSRNTHPRGCSGGLATVLPDDRLADIHLAVGDAFPPIIVRFALRLTESVDLRSTDPTYSQGFWKECGWTSCWSRRRNLGRGRCLVVCALVKSSDHVVPGCVQVDRLRRSSRLSEMESESRRIGLNFDIRGCFTKQRQVSVMGS